MITVACVLKTGGRYDGDWVRRLRSMVKCNLTFDHRFVCLSDVDVEGVECIPLTDDLPGWWSKIELFKHNFGRTMYLDLDVIVTGSLNEIANFDAKIAFMPSHSVIMGTPLRWSSRIKECYQTSCMVWTPPSGRVIYDQFNRRVMQRLHGDQDWIAEVCRFWPKMPVGWFRKLRQCPEGPPPGVRLVLSMPWKNDEAARKFEWVKERWLDGDLLGAQSSVAYAGH